MLTPDIHKRLTIFLQLTLLIGVIFAVVQGRWFAATVTAGIIVITLLPLVLGRRFAVHIPPEFVVLAVVFTYASLYLGEVAWLLHSILVVGCCVAYRLRIFARDLRISPRLCSE